MDAWWERFRVPRAPTAAQLGINFEGLEVAQQRPLMQQRWGKTIATQTAVPAAVPGEASVPRTRAVFINVGPFPEPRALALEQQWNTKGPLAAINPSMKWTIDIGIGEAKLQMICSALPPVVHCQSLQVYGERYDSNPAVATTTLPLSAWAAPYVPRANPTHILTTQVFQAVGTNQADLVVPNEATHVQATVQVVGGAPQVVDLFLECLSVTGDESNGRLQEFIFPGNVPPVYALATPSVAYAIPLMCGGATAFDAVWSSVLTPIPRAQVFSYRLNTAGSNAGPGGRLFILNWYRG